MKEEVWGEMCLIDPEQRSIKPIQTQIYRSVKIRIWKINGPQVMLNAFKALHVQKRGKIKLFFVKGRGRVLS